MMQVKNKLMKPTSRIFKHHLIILYLKLLSKAKDEEANKQQENCPRGAHEMQPQTLSWCSKKH
jgi:hypothetical protein